MQPSPASYFNQVAPKYDSAYDARTPGGYALRVRQQRVLELLEGRGGKVLDVGCGAGRMVPPLVKMGYEFWGVDAAPAMIDLCERRFGKTPRAHFSVGYAQSLKFDDAFFDSVICMGLVDRLQNWKLSIGEMARVLKQDGTLVITFPNLVSPYAWWKNFVFYPAMALLRPIYFRLAGRPLPPTLYNRVDARGRISLLASLAQLETMRASARLICGLGLPVTDMVYYDFNLLLSPLDEFLPGVSLKLSERLEPLRTGRLRWLGAGYALKAIKRDE